MGFLYPELSAPPSTNPTIHVLPSQCVQHHGASETVPVSTGNRWLAWFFQLLSPTFLCVLLWNSIGTIKFSAKTFGLILLETVLGQCGRFRRSWCSRKRGADADTIPTSAGCNGLRSFRLRFFLMVFSKTLATSAALHHLTPSRCRDEMIHSDTRQLCFVLWICVFACKVSCNLH